MIKAAMINELGHEELLLPDLLSRALEANNRAKCLLTLLQMAKRKCEQPDFIANFRDDCGISNRSERVVDAVLNCSRQEAEGVYFIPHLEVIWENLTRNIEEMIAPVRAAQRLAPLDQSFSAATFDGRLKRLLSHAPEVSKSRIPRVHLDAMMAVRGDSDSWHLLIMDLHRELNRLHAALAQESIDGASVYNVHDSDRRLVAAFMRGVNETAPLKFDHPGLGTTATRTGGRLVIQNDIGDTEAHVIVLHIDGPRSTITYTDVHPGRLQFFKDLLTNFNIDWKDASPVSAGCRAEEPYYLSTGTFEAGCREALESYLTFVGSRIVFLVDWNRARKTLQEFVKKKDAIQLLRWAADSNYGHRAFLKMGESRLIYDAVGSSPRLSLRYGDMFHAVLGRERTMEFLKSVLKATADGLLRGKSELLIRDQVRAGLMNYFPTNYQEMLQAISDQASLLVEMGMAVRDGMLRFFKMGNREELERNRVQAGKWKQRAEVLLNKARTISRYSTEAKSLENLLTNANDVAEELDNAIFSLTLLPSNDIPGEVFSLLDELAELLERDVREFLKAVESARILRTEGSREALEDFLAAMDRMTAVEQRAHEVCRCARARVLAVKGDFAQLHSLTEIVTSAGAAIKKLRRPALALKDHVLGEAVAR